MSNLNGSQSWDDIDPSTLPTLPEAHETRRQAVAALLKEQSGSDGFHAKRAERYGESYWRNLAGSMINHPRVDLPRV